jgi:NADH dehydrogenase (ubiquinone) Fe-S protein 6
MNVLIEPIETTDFIVKCEGGAGPLGHPVIYLNLEKEEKVICPYCSRCFINPSSGLRQL